MERSIGRNGSGTVEVETKSGTNNFHGNAYEFFRNDALNSTKYFQDTVQPYKKNDFGYTLGGPVIKNKTFSSGHRSGGGIAYPPITTS
jgi:hypothetical protein